MYDVLSSSFVVNCNDRHFEQHFNSSEFDDHCKANASKCRKRILFVTSETCTQKKNSEKLFLYKVNTNPERCKRNLAFVKSNEITNILELSMEKLLNCHNYDEEIKSCSPAKSLQSGKSAVSKKTSRFAKKQQMFPCLSNMLNNSTKRAEKKFKDTYVGTSGEFACPRCERRRIKKLRRRMFYETISPYYGIGDNRPPLELAHGLRSPLFYNARTIMNQISAASSSSLTSIESDLEYIPWQSNSKRFLKNQILKSQIHDMPKRKILKNKKQQFSSRIRNPYKIIATPCWEENTSKNCESNTYPCSDLQSTSSSFWDYIIDKIAKKQVKQHDHDIDLLKCCPCKQLQRVDESSKAQHCDCKQVQTITCVNASQTMPAEKKPSVMSIPNQNKTTTKTDESSLHQPHKNNTSDRFGTLHAVSRDPSQSSQTINKVYPTPSTSEKIQHQKTKEPDEGAWRKPKLEKTDKTCHASHEKTCQASHEAILKKLKQKYHGEILCIHNPPCILINGCLNLPPPHVKPTTVCYPVTQIKKASVYNLYRRMWRQKLNKDKFAYTPSSGRLQPRNAEDMKHSFFQKHLCELVRMCSKPQYGMNTANRRAKAVKKPPRWVQKNRSFHRQQRQNIKMPNKAAIAASENEVETATPSKCLVMSGETGKNSMSSSSPMHHKSRLMRMISTKRLHVKSRI